MKSYFIVYLHNSTIVHTVLAASSKGEAIELIKADDSAIVIKSITVIDID